VRLRIAVELAEECAKARGPHPSNQHTTPPPRAGQSPRTEHACVTVHVRDDDDDIGALDQRGERLAPATGKDAGVALDAVPALTCELPVKGCVSIDAADEPDVHDFRPDFGTFSIPD
jgi:hypothetical protein